MRDSLLSLMCLKLKGPRPIESRPGDRKRCKHLGVGMYSDVLVYQIDLDGELHVVDEQQYEKEEQ